MKSLNDILLTVLLLLVPVSAHCADRHEWEKYFNELAALDDETTASWEQAYDIMCDMEDNPININTATRDDLEQLPFLTDRQVEDICEYLYRYGPMKTLGELQMIESLDYNRRKILECFVRAGETEKERFPSLKEIASRGRNDLTGTVRIPLYERKGDRNGYLGYKYKHWLRYTFGYGDRIRIGLTAAQDAGEPLFAGKNTMGYDFYSFFLQIRKLGRIETLVLGRYRASFGMGLVINNDFNIGKTAALASLGRSTPGIRASSSRSAAGYLQGAAATIRLGRSLTLSAFASYRPHDATLNKDDGTVATIVKSGYHRTPTEMGKKNNTHSVTAGANVRFFANGFHAGATAVYTRFDRDLRPKTGTLYRRHYASGNDFANAGIDYGYTSHRISAGGETAVNRNGNVATVNRLGVNITDRLSLLALYRFYSYRYTALHAAGFSEGGGIQNENGIYAGAAWSPSTRLRLAAYTDYARFAWPRYQASLPSWASDNMVSASYTAGHWSADARYRLHIRQKDNEAKTALTNRTGHSVRLGLTLNPAPGWSSRTQADLSLTEHKTTDRGLMISESVTLTRKWLQASFFAGYFRTDSYESRLYVYERGPLYNFSFPAFYGKGLRYSLMARADLGRRLILIVKAGVTDYFDRGAIGSGYQKVEGSSMTDIDIQARWKF